MRDGELDPAAEPHFAGLRDGRLLIQRCDACGRHRFPPSPICPRCASPDATWIEASGRGRVLSWVTTHHVFSPAWASRVPYTTVLVELAEEPDVAMFGLSGSDAGLADGAPVRASVDTTGSEPVVVWWSERHREQRGDSR